MDVGAMQQSKRPIAKPASPPAIDPLTDLPELDLGEPVAAPAAKSATTVSSITAVSGADAASIDAQLDALATRTTVEDLARRGKKNLKTLSERQLKEWIREALKRVISTTTSVSTAEQERMLAATRAELGSLMGEATSGGAEREALEAQVAQFKKDRSTLASERDSLLVRLAEMERRLDDAAGQIADAETAAAVSAEPDIEEIESLRSELGQAYTRLSTSENERAGLQKTLGARLVASSEVAAGVLELDQACYGGVHLQAAQSDAAGEEAVFYADEVAARATAGDLVRDINALRMALADATPDLDAEGLPGDQARVAALIATSARAETADPAALAGLQRERDEARQHADSAKRALARMIAQGEQPNQQTTARITRAESDARNAATRLAQLENDLAAAQRQASDSASALTAATAQAGGLRNDLSHARDTQRAAAARAESLSGEVARLTRELATARIGSTEAAAFSAECDRLAAAARTAEDRASASAAVLAVAMERTANAEAARRAAELVAAELRGAAAVPAVVGEELVRPFLVEVTAGRLGHAGGAWRWAWPTPEGIQTATFRGAWSNGETLPVGTAELLHLPEGPWAAWRSIDGHARIAGPDGPAHDLGETDSTPVLSRGTGVRAPFAGITSNGTVLVADGDGLAEALSSRLGCPPAAGQASSWWWAQEDSRHLAYRDTHGCINELLELDGTWYHASLTVHTGCPQAAGDPVGYAPGDDEHVLFRSIDDHIHELCFHGERWNDHDLTALTGAPIAIGQPSGVYIKGRHHVAFRANNGTMHLLRLGGDWRHTALARLGHTESDPILASSGSEGAIAWLSGGRWSWARLGQDPASASAEPLPG